MSKIFSLFLDSFTRSFSLSQGLSPHILNTFSRILLMAFLLGGVSISTAFAQITITPVTWNVIGLDSNRVTDGPDSFPIGVKVCNTSGAAINNLTISYIWDSSNIYVNLDGASTINAGVIPAGSCREFHFIVKITRNSSAYNTTRRYHITASGDGATTVSTPIPREVYVEKLVSQNRNSVASISGPSTVYVGGTYSVTLNGSTATNGYEQFEAFLPFPASIFEVISIATTYTAPTGATNNKFYADACGWDTVPTSGTYRSCIGPVNYSGGKAGGTITTTYTLKVIGAGSSSLSAVIHDFSGSSYHYNSDYGLRSYTFTALNPPDLTIAKSHTGNFSQGQTGATYTLTATNSGGGVTAGTITVTDTLPTGLTPTAATGTGWTCGIVGQTMTCTRSDAMAAGGSYPAITLTVNVSNTAPASIINTASISGGGEVITSNNTANDPTTIIATPHLSLVKSVTPTGNQLPGAELTYKIVYTNDGGTAAQKITLVDSIPDNTDFKIGSATSNAATTGLTLVVEFSNDYSAALDQRLQLDVVMDRRALLAQVPVSKLL